MRSISRPCPDVPGAGWTALALALGLACGACGSGEPRAAREVVRGPAEAAIPEIRAVLDAQVTAWNRGDLAGYMAGYWRSDSLTFFGGAEIERGWQATFERYARRYQGPGSEMGRLALDSLEIEPLGPDAALVRGRWRLERSHDAPHGVLTLAMRRLPGTGWRIVHDHSSAAP